MPKWIISSSLTRSQFKPKRLLIKLCKVLQVWKKKEFGTEWIPSILQPKGRQLQMQVTASYIAELQDKSNPQIFNPHLQTEKIRNSLHPRETYLLSQTLWFQGGTDWFKSSLLVTIQSTTNNVNLAAFKKDVMIWFSSILSSISLDHQTMICFLLKE